MKGKVLIVLPERTISLFPKDFVSKFLWRFIIFDCAFKVKQQTLEVEP